MAILSALRGLIEEPPPAYAFEVSSQGIAWASAKEAGSQAQFTFFNGALLDISPAKDNVLHPEAFAHFVAGLVPPNGSRRRDAALILPDYSTRIALVDFESFPTDKAEQLALVRFRLKKTVPFEIESAAISFQTRQLTAKKTEALVAVTLMEIVSHYEAPFRAAGFHTGLITTSMLSAIDLLPATGCTIAIKRNDGAITVALCDNRFPKMMRTVAVEGDSIDEFLSILHPTMAYAEDEMPHKPTSIHISGFGEGTAFICDHLQLEFGLATEPLRSSRGTPSAYNAGLLGYLQGRENHA
jgi:type IV pilus assembly protein PilM